MIIKRIKDFDDDSLEADLIIADNDNNYELLCYCHPSNGCYESKKKISITTLFANNIVKVHSCEYLIQKLNDYYSYCLQAEVIDKNLPKVCIGKIIIELDMPLPKDINLGDFIRFNVSRLNCFIE